MKNYFLMVTLLLAVHVQGFNQSFNLQQLLKDKKLITNGQHVVPITDGKRLGISSNGIVWLNGVEFSNGTIEIDLRGKDVPQQSFLGIAFHGVDTTTYDAIYFRPFNFQSNDPVRKIHAVQYISEPDYPWQRLREEKNGVYEKGINPPPSPTDWFHARIVVKEATINVYVNNATLPSLTVDKLNDRKNGLIGIWAFGLNGDFADLIIKK
jgi:hypothetical protein